MSGPTYSSNFPTTPGAYDTTYNGGYGHYDAFVAKLDASGSTLLYSTFLGGSNDDFTADIAVDAAGAAVVSGFTYSSNFPTTPGAYDTTYNGGGYYDGDAFVAKLDASGSTLVYSTFLGGSDADDARALALDASGAAVVSGYTLSSNFPTTPGAYDTTYNGSDAFVAKLDASGSTLLYSTFLGGSDGDSLHALALDASGAAIVGGSTYSSDFPTTPGAYDTTYNGPFDAFVAKLDASGSTLVYSTFLGGSDWDSVGNLALDTSGAAVVSGHTLSSNFPTTPGAFDTTYNGPSYGYYGDAFVAKLDASGSTLVYSTFLGGSDADSAYGLALGASGAAVVSGWTQSSNFPTTPAGYDTTYNGPSYNYGDAFVTKIMPCAGASWSNYGSGWPGTNGIPSFTSNGDPSLCSTVVVDLENSRLAATQAVLFIGFVQADIPSAYGGHLLLLPMMIIPLSLPALGIGLPIALPCDSSRCGLHVFMQAWEIDPGASKGVSFTQGLELVLGS